MANEKQEKKTPEIDVDAMVDNHVQKALKALEQFMDMTQEQVDKIVEAMTVAGQENHTRLAKMAVEETGRGVYEDKIIKTCSPRNISGTPSRMKKPWALLRKTSWKAMWKSRSRSASLPLLRP